MAKQEDTLQRTGEAFGEAPPGHGHEAFTDEALFGEEASQPEPQAPVAEAAPDVETVDTVGDQAYQGTDDAGQQQDPAPQTPEQQAEAKRYADRYGSVEDLEYGYKNLQRLQSRTSEQMRAEAARAAQLEAALQQLIAQQQQPQQMPGDFVQDPNELYDPNVLQSLIDQRVAQGTQQVAEQFQQQQLAGAINGAIEQFRQAHPDVVPESPLDQAMAQVVLEFQTSPDGDLNHDLFPVTTQNLETAYTLVRDERLADMVRNLDLIPTGENLDIAREALQNPVLAEVLQAEPELLDTDAGLNHARRLANLPGFYEAAQRQAQPPSAQAQRTAAYVETGGTGAPAGGAPGRRPADEMDEAIAAYNQGRGDSVFTGWRPS